MPVVQVKRASSLFGRDGVEGYKSFDWWALMFSTGKDACVTGKLGFQPVWSNGVTWHKSFDWCVPMFSTGRDACGTGRDACGTLRNCLPQSSR